MSVPSATIVFTRRGALELLFGWGLGAVGLANGCRATPAQASPSPDLPVESPGYPAARPNPYADNLDALCDVLLPVELDAHGQIRSPGAREAAVGQVLSIPNLIDLMHAEGMLPILSDADIAKLADLRGGVRQALNAQLDVLAALQKPLTSFRDLPRDLQNQVVHACFHDSVLKVPIVAVRAACLLAYAGGVASDVGMQALGFPPFENAADGLAVSGYPRTRNGRRIDPETEDLAALAAADDLDDYTYNVAPAPTPGDDLSGVLGPHGDLV